MGAKRKSGPYYVINCYLSPPSGTPLHSATLYVHTGARFQCEEQPRFLLIKVVAPSPTSYSVCTVAVLLLMGRCSTKNHISLIKLRIVNGSLRRPTPSSLGFSRHLFLAHYHINLLGGGGETLTIHGPPAHTSTVTVTLCGGEEHPHRK